MQNICIFAGYMKRVLVITYYWPPTGGSGVQRWVKFSKYLPQEGWQPVIYTPENPEQLAVDHTLAAEIPVGTEVVRTRIIEPYGLYKKFLKKSGHSKEAVEVNPVNAQNKTFLQKAAMWVRGNFFRPDPRCLWIGPSVKFLKEYLKEHPVDLIVSTGPPQSMHLIGRRLARETGLPWIADFRDPWTKIFYFKHLSMTKCTRRWHKKMEQKVLDEADMVVAVSPLVQQEFQAMTQTQVELVTNGYDECDFHEGPCEAAYGCRRTAATDTVTPAVEYRPFSITHTGLFAADGNPTVLWDVLGEKCRKDENFRSHLDIRLIGKTDHQILEAIEAAGLSGNLTDLGYQPHSVATQEQREASLLILPLRKEPEYTKLKPYTSPWFSSAVLSTTAMKGFIWWEEAPLRLCMDRLPRNTGVRSL